MVPLARLRCAPWLGGAVILVLAVGLAAPVAYALGVRRWPVLLGLAAVALLLFGGVGRLWPRRPLAGRHRAAGRLRFRVVPGGKGNGRDSDATDDDGDKPRWVM